MVALSAFSPLLRSLAASLERCQCGGKLFVGEILCCCLEKTLHSLLRRSAALAYTRRWWSILAMGAQSAAIDCILGQDPQVWAPQGSPPLGQILADADIGPEPSRVV